jgi:hypothetical protein
MRSVCYTATVALLACHSAGFAQTKIPCSQTVMHALPSRAALIIDAKPAGLQIVGTDQEAIHVSCMAGSAETVSEVSLHFSPTPNGGKLSIEGPHLHHGNNNLEVKVEVPRRTNLQVRMMAGQVTVNEVKGDKDIDLGAGQITIASIHDGDYRSVNASVGVGEVQAQAFGTDKGGFFRSFSRKNPGGEYGLHAHVTTGQIVLSGNAQRESNGAKPD